MPSVEGNYLRAAAVTAVAPVAWGTTYLAVEWLPPDRPLFTALVRALPVGLLLLAWRRELPRGAWWWRTAVVSLCTIGLFFPLLFLGAYLLPAGLASTLQAASPIVMVGLAWWMLQERPTAVSVGAAVVGALGVVLLVLRAPSVPSPLGVVAALASMAIGTLGFALVKRWQAPTDMITYTAWQLVAGGLILLPIAFLVEGPAPAIDLPAALAYLWIAIPGTAIAYVCWFTGLRTMPAGAVTLIGLLNPVVATALGVVVLHEQFGWTQAVGMALVLGSVVAGQPALVGALRRRRLARQEGGLVAGSAGADHAGEVVQGGSHARLEVASAVGDAHAVLQEDNRA